MATYVPAMRARMGDTEFYLAAMTMGEAARLIQYVEEVDDWTAETPPELKLQRKLNIQRVEREMVPYLVQSSDHFYSPLTVEVRPAPFEGERPELVFEERYSVPGGLAVGMLTLDGTELLYALDGQHRLKSIELAIRQKPALAREQIGVVLVPFQTVTRSQTLFSDLNRYARQTSKSTSLLFTHREKTARVAKRLAHVVPLLRDRVEMEQVSLSKNTRHFITLSTLYEMTRALIGEHDEERDDEHEHVAELAGVWDVLTDTIPEWGDVAASREHPAWLRQRFLHGHGITQQAIGLVVARVRRERGDGWADVVRRLGTLDRRLANAEWHDVALHGGRVTNTSTSIRRLADLLAAKLGLTSAATATTA
jgi:DNA sulfur modification protein DndB